MKSKKQMAKLIGHAAVAAACALTQFAFGELAKMEVSPGASTIDVHVVDDRDGKPMANLTVEAEFAGILSMGYIYDEKYRQCTDADGRCLFKGQNNNPYAYIAVPPGDDRDIYWTERKIMLNRALDEEHRTAGDCHSITLRVQRVDNPIPLYIKEVRGGGETDFFGEGNDTVSCDLLVGDWLPPLGTGIVADVVFTRLKEEHTGVVSNLCREVHLYRDRLKVTFPGAGNGIVEVNPLEDSDLLVREAPLGGYQHNHMSYSGYDKDGIAVKSWYPINKRAYCFRIRSKINEQGVPVEGYYGKVHGGFMFDYVMTKDYKKIPVGAMNFKYFLNLTPLDRNLEWDEKTNLNPERR